MLKRWVVAGALCGLLGACAAKPAVTRNFGDDAAFLSKRIYTVTLADQRGLAHVVVVPGWQGRVMTSTADGVNGQSFGWINYDLITANRKAPHINAYGGEERLWIGPEGGQFGLFFPPMSGFDAAHWQVPAALDTEAFDIVEASSDRVTTHKEFDLQNYTGSKFRLDVTRTVRLLTLEQSWRELGVTLTPGMKLPHIVAYESSNTVKNAGRRAWKKENGLLSMWILGMLNASPGATVAAPLREGAEKELGPAVQTGYFGEIPGDRLQVKDGVAYFRADGKQRGKIGISAKRTKGVLGSYDALNGSLTIVQFMPIEPRAPYVNSQWKIQSDPFNGDAANAYNDDGKLGAFYELESSSPGLELAPGQAKTHVSRTYHMRGDEASLDAVSRAVLGVGVKEIAAALPGTVTKKE